MALDNSMEISFFLPLDNSLSGQIANQKENLMHNMLVT